MTDSLTRGTTTSVPFSRIVDGDTIKIFRSADAEKDESVRILCLDTEESYSAGSKPVTPWGREAKAEAERFFQGAEEVTIEFPGNDPLSQAFERYRGNFGRLLVFVYYNGVDFQEYMIRKGYSPYFNKYGNAVFSSHHRRYQRAERAAQQENIGVWNQIAVNGSVIRDYPKLTAWWTLRANIIDEYRRLKEADASVYNTRTDYDQLKKLAENGDTVATIFTEVRDLRRVNSDAAIIGIGSRDKPFNLYIPNVDTEEGDKIIRLLRQRYISEGEANPKRSYCYVTGLLNTYRGNPQMVVTNENDISDSFEKRTTTIPKDVDTTGTSNTVTNSNNLDVKIIAALPNPDGRDSGNETVTIVSGESNQNEISLQGWTIQDRGGGRFQLDGNLKAGEKKVVRLSGRSVTLNNRGDIIRIVDNEGRIVNEVSYSGADVKSGVEINF